MATPARTIIVIPARMASTRLPGKPLADIHGQPMIVHVMRRALEADAGPVVVAAAEEEIAAAVRDAGGRAVLTRPDHASGSDRIFEALGTVDPDGRYDSVLNVQGDLPTLAPGAIRAALLPLAREGVDISTLVVPIQNVADRVNPNIVKAVVAFAPGRKSGRALYFSRAPVPWGVGPLYHHIGLYGFRRAALAEFVRLPAGILERRERLEQLRALEAGMRIEAALVDTVPLGVDTPADLERARAMLAPA